MPKTKRKPEEVLNSVAKKLGLEIDFIEYFNNLSEWTVVLKSENEDDAERFRYEISEAIEGTKNTLGASFDDIPGMGEIHLGIMRYSDYSEANGGDRWEDLDEDIRDEYTVFAVPRKVWINYRRMTDY